MALYRILVLGATFFIVGLCPVLDLAVAVFGAGIAVYLCLWGYESYAQKKTDCGDKPL